MLGERFEQALVFAGRVHADQRRKGNDVPYVAHLLAVCAIVLEHGGDEDQAIAALLHDAAEDQGGVAMLDQIGDRFGRRVRHIVEQMSDALVAPGEAKPPWRDRKAAFIDRMRSADADVLLIALADKVHNSATLLGDLHRDGNAAFDKFNGKKDGTLWYYRTLLDVFGAADAPTPPALLQHYARIVEQIERLAEPTA